MSEMTFNSWLTVKRETFRNSRDVESGGMLSIRVMAKHSGSTLEQPFQQRTIARIKLSHVGGVTREVAGSVWLAELCNFMIVC
jgi:hypothetical protein